MYLFILKSPNTKSKERFKDMGRVLYKMRYKFLIAFLFIFFVLVFFPKIINADIISLNSGGGDGMIINPGGNIEGFFTGDIIAVGAVCGNSIIETGEQCDDGNTVSGDGCSSTCQTEVPSEDGGGGGAAVTQNIVVNPTEFNINLAVNTNVEEEIIVTNLGESSVNLSVFQENLQGMILLSDTFFELGIGESKIITVVFIALSQTGIFTGKIRIGNKAVLVSLNIRTKLLLFDSNIVVLNRNYLVKQGDKLETEVTLIPLGDPDRLDVRIDYVIKNFDNKTFLTHSETLLIEEEIKFRRDFDTGILPVGPYVVGLELIYPNGVAPSSASFEITERSPFSFGKVLFYLIMLILIIAIIILIILIYRWYKRQKQNEQNVR